MKGIKQARIAENSCTLIADFETPRGIKIAIALVVIIVIIKY
jgi:hypothetical protein